LHKLKTFPETNKTSFGLAATLSNAVKNTACFDPMLPIDAEIKMDDTQSPSETAVDVHKWH